MGKVAAVSEISLDYAKSDDPAEIDQGIRETIRGVRISILTMGIGLARIKTEGLFRKLKFRSMSAYVDHLCEETEIDRSSIYSWLGMGEAYIKYGSELETIGFTDQDGPSKLPYLERALALGRKDEVFTNLKNMSLREFTDFAKSGNGTNPDAMPFLEIRGNTFYLQGQKAIIVNKNLGSKNTEMLTETVRVVCRALERGGTVVAVHLRSSKEADRFAIEAKRIRAKIQTERIIPNLKQRKIDTRKDRAYH